MAVQGWQLLELGALAAARRMVSRVALGMHREGSAGRWDCELGLLLGLRAGIALGIAS